MKRAVIAALCLLASTPAIAQEKKVDVKKAEPSVFTWGGYGSAGVELRHRPVGLPRDRWVYDLWGTVGLLVEARPIEMWSARLDAQFTGRGALVVTDVGQTDLDFDGRPEELTQSKTRLSGLNVEQAVIRFEPSPMFNATAGSMRIPFTAQTQSASSALLFPTRAPPNEIFLTGADLGATAQGDFADGIFTVLAGVFKGDSLGPRIDRTVTRGVVIAGRTDINPFGRFNFYEGDPQQGPFRLGIGGGILYRPAAVYDENTGYESTGIHDMRFSASLRMAVAGFYVGVEYLRRLQLDDTSNRPLEADGAYAQASFFWRITDNFAMEPIARIGFTALDESFDTRLIGGLDGGLSFYPRADHPRPDILRLTIQYVGEQRFTEDESAHGGSIALQLKF